MELGGALLSQVPDSKMVSDVSESAFDCLSAELQQPAQRSASPSRANPSRPFHR